MAMKRETSYHIASHAVCAVPESIAVAEVSYETVFGRLARVIFPYAVNKYPGRILGMCRLLGIAPQSYAKYAKPCGEDKLSPVLCERAAFLCDARSQELSALANEFREQARVKRAKQITGPKGMLEVRVRDASGIPRTARGHGRGNGVICHPKKPDPF